MKYGGMIADLYPGKRIVKFDSFSVETTILGSNVMPIIWHLWIEHEKALWQHFWNVTIPAEGGNRDRFRMIRGSVVKMLEAFCCTNAAAASIPRHGPAEFPAEKAFAILTVDHDKNLSWEKKTSQNS